MLSKSDFLLFRESSMHLWAKTHHALEAKTKSPHDQFCIQQGQVVEGLAQKYIKSVILPKYDHCSLLWQQSFSNGVFEVRTDAMIFDQDAEVYDLYEIKSSTSIDTTDEYDVTFQALVVEKVIPLRHSFIIYIDKSYEFEGTLDIEKLFISEDVSDITQSRREEVLQLRQTAQAITKATTPDPQWACTKPETCPCLNICHPDLPEHPIYDLPRLGKKALELRNMGVTDTRKIPKTFKLSENQAKHARAMQTGKAIFDRVEIRNKLGDLKYPLYFLDYEFCNPAIPLFRGYHPYENIVFQYSLHKLTNAQNASAIHKECLILDRKDPTERLVKQLLNDIGTKGSVIVWWKTAEKNRNEEMARRCPEYADQILKINDRLFDLMEIFSKGLYVHPDFHGSASIKDVLPVVCPGLTYKNLKISDGLEAMMTYWCLQQKEPSPEEIAQIRVNLLAYCKLDTEAMVAIYKFLQ